MSGSPPELCPRPFNRAGGSFVWICGASVKLGTEPRIVHNERRLPLVEHLAYLPKNRDDETDSLQGDPWHAAKNDISPQDSGKPVDQRAASLSRSAGQHPRTTQDLVWTGPQQLEPFRDVRDEVVRVEVVRVRKKLGTPTRQRRPPESISEVSPHSPWAIEVRRAPCHRRDVPTLVGREQILN